MTTEMTVVSILDEVKNNIYVWTEHSNKYVGLDALLVLSTR